MGEAMSSWLDKIVPAGILTTLGNKIDAAIFLKVYGKSALNAQPLCTSQSWKKI